MKTLQPSQTIAPLGQGTLRLGGSVVSPYFQLTATRKIGPLRDIQFIPVDMIKAFLLGYSPASTNATVDALLRDTNNVYNFAIAVPLTIGTSDTDATIRDAAPGAVVSYLGTLGITVDSTEWIAELAGLGSAPQAAITDCPADATTNYNTVTTLLGAVTGAVNTANTKQNQIATQLNTLLAELRTLGLIHV